MTALGVGVAILAGFSAGFAVAWKCGKWRDTSDRSADRMVCTMQGYSAGFHDGKTVGRSEQAVECARRNHPSRPLYATRLEDLMTDTHPEAVTN